MSALHEKYEWSYKAQYNETNNSIVFSAGAKPRDVMTEAPPKNHPDYEAFEMMCAEWHTSVTAFRESLEQEGFEVRHSIGEVNTNLSTEEVTIFTDTFTFSEGTDVCKVYETLEHQLTLINEVVDFLNNDVLEEKQAATS